MAIGSLSRSEFLNRLYKVVRPSTPIDSPEFLFGRSKQIIVSGMNFNQSIFLLFLYYKYSNT